MRLLPAPPGVALPTLFFLFLLLPAMLGASPVSSTGGGGLFFDEGGGGGDAFRATNEIPRGSYQDPPFYGGSNDLDHHHHHDSSGSAPPLRVMARAGTNMSLACPGVGPATYIYLVEWKCLGCDCRDCPNPNGEGSRLLRYNDKMTKWGGDDRRSLDYERYALRFGPVSSKDSGTYLCLLNNRREPDAPIILTVQDVPDPPPSRPLVVRLDSRSVDLSWAPPRRIHHHPVTSYKIFIKEGESGSWSRSVATQNNGTSMHIKGLSPFTTYIFKVAAKNALGYSAASKESYPTKTHREPPSGTPEFLLDKMSTSSGSLSVVWRPPPPDTINGEFLGYELTYRPDGPPGSTDDTTKSTRVTINEDVMRVMNYTILNLQKHTNYRVTLAVKNLRGVGPNATVELRTEDGVPLEPRAIRFRSATASSIEVNWQPPANADALGRDLLGYRLYLTEKCDEDHGRRKMSKNCRRIKPMTVNNGAQNSAVVGGLSPFTKYRIVVRAFTKKREGPASDALVVTTDADPPDAPIITNLTCHGANGIQVEWRRPSHPRLATSAPIHHYAIHLRSNNNKNDDDVIVDVMNDTVRNVAFLSNLTSDGLNGGAVYDISVTAYVESSVHRGRLYRGPPSLPRRVFVGRECDPHQAFSKIPSTSSATSTLEYDAGVIAGVVCTATAIVLVALILVICRRHRPRYEFLALTPKSRPKQAAANGGSIIGNGAANGHVNTGGWCGDSESDIPLSVFAKHVVGMHAAGDMAFHKDFEAIHQARSMSSANGDGHQSNGVSTNGVSNGKNGPSGKAATTFPDILGGGRDTLRNPYYIDGWLQPRGFVCVLCESPFAHDAAWKRVWDDDVELIVSILTPGDKDDLSTLSEAKKFGDLTVSLLSEDILVDYTIRTIKLSHRPRGKGSMKKGSSSSSDRHVTQLVFGRWPPSVGLPNGADLLGFAKTAFSCRGNGRSRAMVQSRCGLDSCLIYCSLESCLAQAASRGELNAASFHRHAAERHGLALSSVAQYVYVHDALAEAAEFGALRALNGGLRDEFLLPDDDLLDPVNQSLTMPV